jgi:hypothetical protein
MWVAVCLGIVFLPEVSAGQSRVGDPRLGSRFAIDATLGYSWLTGEVGDSITGGVGAELAVVYQTAEIPLRFGLAGGYASLSFEAGGGSADKWSVFGLATYLIVSEETEMLPYVQGRVGWTQFSDDRLGVKSTASGFEIGAAAGVDIPVAEKISIDVVGLFNWINLGPTTVQGIDIPDSSKTGSAFGLRAGAIFFLE